MTIEKETERMHVPAFVAGYPVETSVTYEDIDPSTGDVLATVTRCGPDEVDQAVVAAREAQPAWAGRPTAERADLLLAIADAIAEGEGPLARLESEDTGKPLSQARADTRVCARYFQYYGRAIETFHGETIPLRPDLHAFTTHEPFGVTAHIVAWNYPMQLYARGVAPALAVGNCCVAKPASETPRTAVRIAQIASECGLPAGVLNVVTGPGSEVGAALTGHPDVDQVGFVGSAETGVRIAHATGDRLVPATLELGGKSAHLVFPDADLERAAAAITNGILQNAGQTCSAGSRLVVHREVHDDLVRLLVDRFAAVRMGPGVDDLELGPLISRSQQERVTSFVTDREQGEVIVGGDVPSEGTLADGCYYPPTIVDNVDPTSRLAQEEVFGPVLAVMSFQTAEEAVALANATEYALMGAVWGSDISRALSVARQVVAGQVYVNAFGAGGGVELPFGGFRRSGYGREKGVEALRAYTQTKTFIVAL